MRKYGDLKEKIGKAIEDKVNKELFLVEMILKRCKRMLESIKLKNNKE